MNIENREVMAKMSGGLGEDKPSPLQWTSLSSPGRAGSEEGTMNIENREVTTKMSGGLGEDKMSGGLGEDKPLYLSPRQDSPTMDDVVTCA